MSNIFNKLNLREQREILVIAAPASFAPELAVLDDLLIHRQVEDSGSITFSLAFVTTRSEVERLTREITARVSGDAILWFAYPKKSSRLYQSELSRDAGWEELGRAGYECVRMVAIDEDWSAARFRHVDFIRKLQRDEKRLLGADGKRRRTS